MSFNTHKWWLLQWCWTIFVTQSNTNIYQAFSVFVKVHVQPKRYRTRLCLEPGLSLLVSLLVGFLQQLILHHPQSKEYLNVDSPIFLHIGYFFRYSSRFSNYSTTGWQFDATFSHILTALTIRIQKTQMNKSNKRPQFHPMSIHIHPRFKNGFFTCFQHQGIRIPTSCNTKTSRRFFLGNRWNINIRSHGRRSQCNMCNRRCPSG